MADVDEVPSIDASFMEKATYIESLQTRDIEANINAVALSDVRAGSIGDITVDSTDIVFGFAQLRNMLDGSGALDSSTGNGYDSSLSNKVVRTHDSITYQLGYGLQLSASQNESVYRDGKLYVRLVLPVLQDKAQFGEKSIECITNQKREVVNGQQIVTGEYVLPKNDQGFSIPCAGRIDVTVNINDMKNGTTIQPRFELSSKPGVWEKSIVPPACTITCRGAYNISTTSAFYNHRVATTTDYQGIPHPRSFEGVCDININPIYAEDDNGEKMKKKGVFFPDNLRFDVDYWVNEDNSNTQVGAYFRDWGIRANQGNYTGSDFNKYNNVKSFSSSRQPTSGSVSLASHKKFTVTLSGIPRDGTTIRVILLGAYPATGDTCSMHLRYSNAQYNDNGYKNIVDGELEEWSRSWHEVGTGSWVDYFTFTDNCDKEDSEKPMHLYYSNGHRNRQLPSGFEEGDTRLSRGDEFMSIHEIDISGLTQVNETPKSINMYTFFDANCFEPLEVNSMGVRPHVSCANGENFFSTTSVKIMYLAKRTGGNWSSQADMASVKIENVGQKLRAFNSLAELRASGATCIGIVCELRGVVQRTLNTTGAILVDMPMKIKASATQGATYMVSGGTIMWSGANVASHSSNWFTTPPGWVTGDMKADGYRKTEFNAQGVVTRSHNDPRDGQTVFINYVRALLDIDVAQTDNGVVKKIYKFSEGDKYVWVKAIPSYKGVIAGNNNWTYSFTLPKGIKVPTNKMLPGQDWGWVYDGGTFSNVSIYGENGSVTGGTKIIPTVTNGANGTQVVKFSKSFSSSADFKPFYMKLEIDSDYVMNGLNYTITGEVTGDGAFNVDERYGNKDKTGMTVVLKNAVTIAKTGLTQIEYGEKLRYSLHITNQGTTVNGMSVRDLLPPAFSGTDSKATYTLSKLNLLLRQGDYTYGGTNTNDIEVRYRRPNDTSTDKGMSSWSVLPKSECSGVMSPKEITAIGIKGTLPAGMAIVLDIELTLNDSAMGDTFYNGFVFEGDSFPEPINSNLVKTTIPIRTAKLTIEKKLKANTYVSAKGEYIFHYKISSLDNDREDPVVFYKTIKVSSGTSNSITFDLPARVYKVEELCPNDWSISNKQAGAQSYLLRPVTDWRDIGYTGSVSFTGSEELYAKLNQGGTGKVIFTNQGSFKDYTHNNEVLNSLK